MAPEVGSRPLGDLCDPDRGITYGIVKVGDFVPGGVPVIRGGDIRGGRVVFDGEKRVSEEVSRQFRRTILRGGEIVINLIAEPGHTAIVPRELAGANVSRDVAVIALGDDVDHKYVDYFLKSSVAVHWLTARLQGSVTQKINLATLRELPVPLLPRAEQSAIAQILCTLDDKIELNRRMNGTLEAIVRAIFKSWFVDFDPVRAKAEDGDLGLPNSLADLFPDSFEESELGEVPKGWRAGQLDEVLAELVSGARPKGGAADEGVPSIGAENVIGLGRYDFSKEKFVPLGFFEQLKIKGAAVRPGDVLLYKDGAHIGRKTYLDCDFPHAECAINEHVFILRANRPEKQRFLFFWLDQAWMTHEIISLNSNSAQPGINQPGVRSLPILIPRDGVINAFDKLAVRLTGRLFANCNESRTLAGLRDTLLPKLLSGKLRVKDAERIVSGAV